MTKSPETSVVESQLQSKERLRRFFGNLKKPLEGSEDPVADQTLYHYADQEAILTRIINEGKQFEGIKQKPHMAAEAFLTLACKMDEQDFDKDSVDRKTIDKQIQMKKNAELIFMDTCSKLYGHGLSLDRLISGVHLLAAEHAKNIIESKELDAGTSYLVMRSGHPLDQQVEKVDSFIKLAIDVSVQLLPNEGEPTEEVQKQIELLNKFVYSLKIEKEKLIKQIEAKKEQVATKVATRQREVDVARNVETDKAMEAEIREKILMAAIEQQGGTGVSTSFPYGFAPSSVNAGFGDMVQQTRGNGTYGHNDHPVNFALGSLEGAFRSSSDTTKRERGFFTKKTDVNEIVILTPHIITESHTEVVKKHVFKSDEVKTTINQRKVAHNEVVANGSNEMAYRFVYYAADSGNEPSSTYLDYSGRGGQYLAVDTLIPESIAKQVAEKLKEDPTFARRLGEYLSKQNRNVNKTAEEWDALWLKGERKDMYKKDVENKIPLRPPYEEWAQNRGGASNMFVKCEVPGVYEPTKDPKESIVKIKAK